MEDMPPHTDHVIAETQYSSVMTSFSDLVMHKKPLRTAATAIYPYDKKLEDHYTFTSRFGQEVPLFRRDGNVIHLPRALCPVGHIDERDDGDAVLFPKGPTPRPAQSKVFKDIATIVKERQSGVVLAPTGSGKTIMGLHAAYVMQRKTLVITTKEDIYDQWRERAAQFLGITDEDIGEIRGDKCQVVGTKFCVALIQSLSRADKYPDWITKGFGLVIFDEIHRLGAEQFSRVAPMFPAVMRLGLSATPERADGKELIFLAHIGPIRVRMTAEQLVPKFMLVRSAWKCPRNPQGKKLYHEGGKTMHVEKLIAMNPRRNALIGELARNCYEKGRRTVIFSSLLDHLDDIKEVLVKDNGIPVTAIGLYVGATSKAEKALRDKEATKPIVLTTWTMTSEGTDLPWLDTCILAMPRSNVVQPVGRIRREYPNKKDPVVIDIIDDDSPVFASYARNRQKWYRGIGAEIINIDI